MADDLDIRHTISSLVDEEKDLRSRLAAGGLSESDEHARLQAVETELDRCWDLLRQRRALRDSGANPEDAHVRDADTVERYLQ